MRVRMRATAAELLRVCTLQTPSLRVLVLSIPLALRRAARARQAAAARALLASAAALVALVALLALLRAPPALSDEGDLAGVGGAAALRAAVRGAAGSGALVVLLVVDATFAPLAFNAICHLRRLRVSNYLAVALDARAFALLAKQGARVFFWTDRADEDDNTDDVDADAGNEADAGGESESVDGAVFGTRAFMRLSWRKCDVVREALSAGIDALLTDADVAWVADVRSDLPDVDVAAASDARPDEIAAHGRNSVLNSGLYRVRASGRTRAAFGHISRYARATRRSEQKAFNHVLCGAFRDIIVGPGRRVGRDRCEYVRRRHRRPHGGPVSVAVLDPVQYPNGSDALLWNTTMHNLVAVRRVRAVHANYVIGAVAKIKRLRDVGLWIVADDGSTCLPFNPGRRRIADA